MRSQAANQASDWAKTPEQLECWGLIGGQLQPAIVDALRDPIVLELQ